MADKKPSGFKTFILLMFTFALAFFLGCGAYLMLGTNTTLFGLCYISNVEADPISQVSNGTDTPNTLHFNDYDQVIVNTSNLKTGNASVEVNCGTAGNNMSTIVLDKCSRGFAYVDARKDYALTVSASSHILYITLIEPQYNFIQITNATVLKLNVCSTENIQNVEFEIITNNGNVTFGGATTATSSAKPLTTPSLIAQSQNGSITVATSATVRNKMNLSTVEGAITIQGNQNTENVSLSASKRNITAKDFTNTNTDSTVNFESFNSHIKVGSIAGNAVLQMTSGTFEFNEIGGTLSTNNTTNLMQYTYIYGSSVGGSVSISNLGGAFTLRIASVGGAVSIYGGRLIQIGELLGQTNIKTSGAINVKKAETNSFGLNLETTANGSITAMFDAVFGTNIITTNSGIINASFQSTSQYFLSASTSGRVLRTWLDSTTNPLESVEVGASTPSTANNLTLTSTNGNITIGRY